MGAIIIVVLVFATLAIWAFLNAEKGKKEYDIWKFGFQQRLRENDFDIADSYELTFNKSGIAIDTSSKRILAFDKNNYKFISTSDIISCDLEIHEKDIVTTTKGKHTIGRAVIGGVLLGPAGAVVGALSSKKKSVSQQGFSHAILDITINDISSPISQILFWDRAEANKWLARVQVIINQRNQ